MLPLTHTPMSANDSDPLQPGSTQGIDGKNISNEPEPQTLEEWSDQVLRKMEELHRNEDLRREIARRLS